MKTRFFYRYLLPFIAIMMILGCAGKESPVVLTVGDQKMDVAMFIQQFQKSSDYKNFSEFTIQHLKKFSNKYLVDNLLFQAEGYARGYDRDSLIIARIEQEKKRMMTRGNGLLYEKIISKDFPVEDEEIKEFYDHLGQEIKIAYIMIKSEKLADSLYDVLQKGENFSQLAYKFSMDLRTARNGGEIKDYTPWGFMGLALDSVAFKIEPGQISKPIKTIIGYHIIKLLDKKERKRQPFNDVKESIRKKIKTIKLSNFIEKYITRLYKKYHVEYDKSLIANILGIYSDKAGLPVLIESKLTTDQRNAIFVTFDGGSWTVQNFISIYNATPRALRHSLKYKDDVIDFIYKAVSQDLMYEEAIKMKLDRDAEFVKESALAKNTIILQHCKDLLVYKRVDVSDKEVQDYYDANKVRFGEKSLNMARSQIINRLRYEKIEKKSRKAASQLKEKFAVEYNEKGLEKAITELNKLKNS